jgi:chromosome partitioning protein
LQTTTAINLAASLAVAEKKVLLCDNDPQANATSGVGATAEEDRTIYQVIVGDLNINEAIIETQMPYLWILPSHINLVGAEIELVELPGRESLLAKALQLARNRFDYIIIDCPPSLGLLTLNAINMVKKTFNPNLDIEGVLLTMFDSRLRLSNQILEEVKRYFGDKVFKTIVTRNIRLSEAPSFGKPILLYDAVCSGTRNYMQLAREVLRNHKVSMAETTLPHHATAEE